jgi:hypothetical protein
MVASTTETSFNKISFNQKNFHVLSFIYRLKLKQFENLNGIKNSFKLHKILIDLLFTQMPKLVEPKIINHKKTKGSEDLIMIVNLFLKQRYKKALQNMSCGEYVLAIEQVEREINDEEIF